MAIEFARTPGQIAGAGLETMLAATDLASKTGHTVEHVLNLFEEGRTRELFDVDGKLIRRQHHGIPGELALRLLELDRLKSR
ncbi:hypothetical protein [Mycobacterium scrofulaceum]|uniref:hypothetical protein n=1 Tax=Mycobacterium scrofulaceum TaxID=1783 RepID=UPI0012E9FC47|nr:hypothetical protein [Mycobacterium scrofulaceum]